MLDVIVKEIADTVRESVQDGVKSIEGKLAAFEARLKALEDAEPAVPVITMDEIKEEMVKHIAAIELPQPKEAADGKDAIVDYESIKSIIMDAVKEQVAAIELPKPKDGIDGRDGAAIEIMPSIDEEKSYPRGVFASHNGGLWRSYEKTHGMRGWECVVDGIHSIDMDYDGARKAVIKIRKAGGETLEKDIHIPALLTKGVWREGAYQKGDVVQLSGSSWLAVADTDERPGDGSKAWIIAAKAGGTGKSAYDIAKQAGFTGTKQEWLDSLGRKPTVKV